MLAGFGNGRINQARSAVHQALERVGARRHLTELVFDRAEVRDRMAELLPLLRVLCGLADDGSAAAAAHRTKLEPAEVQRIQRDLRALTNLAKQVLRWHRDVLQQDRRRR